MTADPVNLRIVLYPAPILQQKAVEIVSITDEIRSVASQMLALMRDSLGVGLAAPQVGIPWRMFVTNATGDPGDDQVFINPLLVNLGRELVDQEEGCLSLPDVRGVIRRPVSVTLRALDLDGRVVELFSDSMSARIWQHEVDHLDGILILQRMTVIDRMANRCLVKSLESDFDGC